jgi:hypothetical protein
MSKNVLLSGASYTNNDANEVAKVFLASEGELNLSADTTVNIGTLTSTQVNLGSNSCHVNAKGNLKVEKALYDSLNSAGTTGKVLCSTGTGVKWETVTSGDSFNTGSVHIGGTSSTTTVNLGSSLNEVVVKGELKVEKAIYDSLNSAGTTGKVLCSTGTGVKWDTITDGLNTATVNVGTLASTFTVNLGQSSNNVNVKGDLKVEKALYDSLNSAGTTGKVLFSTGTGVKWDTITFPSDKLNESSVNIGGTSATTLVSIGSSSATTLSLTAGSIALNGNVSLPFGKTLTLSGNLADSNTSTGSSGQVLTKSSLGVMWQDPSAKLSYVQGRRHTAIVNPTSAQNVFNPVSVTAPTADATYLLQGGFTMGPTSGGQPSLACSFCVDQGNTSLTSNAVNVINNVTVGTAMAAQTSLLGAKCSNTNCVSYSYIYKVREAGEHTFGLFTSADGNGGALFQSFLNVIQIG